MKLRSLLVATISICAIAACSRNRDKDAQKLIDEISSLDRAVIDGVKAAPNAKGLGKAEALVNAKRKNLRERFVAMRDAQLSPEASMALANQSVRNEQSARVALEYVENAVLKSDPALVARANKLADSLCEITATQRYDECAFFKRHRRSAAP